MKMKYLLITLGLIITAFECSEAQNCRTTCLTSNLNDTDACNVTSGECLYGCQDGYTGINCTVVCPDQCAQPAQDDDDVCNATTMECTSGCNVGFAGLNCTEVCPMNCKHPPSNGSDTCNSTSGDCLHGCNIGYTGTNCSMDCPGNCAIPLDESIDVCNASSGECSIGCVQGFVGPFCTVECPAKCTMPAQNGSDICNPDTGNCIYGCQNGFAGHNCTTECPANCAMPAQNGSDICNPDTGNCTYGCKNGFAGHNCSTECPANCAQPSTAFADTCDENSLECSFGCEDGFMGPNCTQSCPQNCRSPGNVCDAMSGQCSFGCDDGFAGDNCSFVCPHNCHPPLMNLTETCNITSSDCLSGCNHGFAGPNCSVTCPENCGRSTDPTMDACDAETGQCAFGCSYGFTGENCSVPCPSKCAEFADGEEQITCNATTLECTNGCDVTYTGAYCNESCPANCDRCITSNECTECMKGSFRTNGRCVDCPWQCNAPTSATLRTCSEDSGSCEFGCQTGWYGQRCKTRCKSTCKDNVCERLSGKCSNGCISTEFTGLTCEDYCNDGCFQKTCDQTGNCLDGCLPTFWGDTCDTLCHDHCREGPTDNDNVCDISDGTCVYGCDDDLYWDKQCTTACSSFCGDGVCEQTTGNCTNGCSSDEVYGIGCTERCNENCVNGTCFRDGDCNLGCQDGWYGDLCDKPCEAHCYGDVCARDHGFCSSGCDTGWYGTYCTETCGLNCVNKTCYIDTGNCTYGCVFGSQGPKCDTIVTITPSPPESIDTMWIYVGIAVGGVIVIGMLVIMVLVARRRKVIIERRRRTTMYENYPEGLQEQVERRERKKKKGPVARITQMIVENPLALLMRGNRAQNEDDDIGAYTKIAVDDLLDMAIQAEESGGNEEFDKLKTGLTKPHDESRKLENLALNFFSETFPYDENRVILGQGKRRDDHHSIMKDKSRDDTSRGDEKRGRSVHFTAFGKTNKQSDKKTTNVAEYDNFKITAEASNGSGTSDGDTSVDADQTSVLFSKKTNDDGTDGQAQIVIPESKVQSDNVTTQNASKRDYINASYIKAQNGTIGYIAAQAPAHSTVNDFWSMIWEQESTMIVMLTGNDRDGNLKCEKYWPDTGSSATFGDINVTCESCDEYVIHTMRRLKIQNGDDVRDLIQHQFTDWPVIGCPASAISFIEFHQRNKSLRSLIKLTGPIVVHCTAGVGRTGVFIGLDYLVDEGTATGYVNIYKCVEQLREQRVNMVAGSDQYDFLYKALAQSFALECQLVNRSSLQDMLTRLRKLDIEHGGKQKMEYLFKNLRDSLSLDTSEIASLDVVQERQRKDRPTSDVPDMLYRADLPHGMYINAVLFDTFRYKDTMIAAQMPTPQTLADFCQLLIHKKCDTVVMLNNCDPNDKSLGYYWPKHKKHDTIGNVKITNVDEDKKSDIDIVTRTLKMEVKQTDQGSPVREITMIQYKGWKIVKNVPNVKNILKLLSVCRQYVNKSSDKHLLVHCMNGSEQSGLFCALYNILDQLDTESEISITCIVRSIMARLPAAITSAEQLESCFSAACTHIAESAISQE